MPASTNKNIASNSLAGIWTILLIAFVIAFLYFGREVLIPMALATLLTFLLAPLVTRIERWAGRIGAVLIVVALVLVTLGGTGWLITRQVLDLAGKLPDYQVNIENKLRSVQMPEGSTLKRLSNTIERLKKAIPENSDPAAQAGQSGLPAPPAVSVRVVEAASSGPLVLIKTLVEPLIAPLGMMALVLLLLIFMLLKREDLRSRIIRLIGQGRISATTHAMDDAGRRVARYLLMQLIVNASYGGLVALGLYFLGLPNVLLWGMLAAVLRFIPYVGPWIGAAFPLVLSLAISTSWSMPILTFGLFVFLELVNSNAVEPWLYGTTTGVSSVALIIAAVFWTWLWGPVGLVLSTPLTVCLVVMGLHVPKLAFLGVLLSDERALAPHEEFYHRLIALDPNEVSQFSEAYLKANSLEVVYDTAVIPALIATEMDYRAESLDAEQRNTILRDIHDLIEDFGQRPIVEPVAEDKQADPAAPDKSVTPVPAAAANCRVLCLPVREERDELTGLMLAQLLARSGFQVETASAKLMTGELLELVAESKADAVCLSVVAPSTVIHARYLVSKLRARFPQLKILVGLWAATEELVDASTRLRASGADGMVTTLAEAVIELGKFSIPLTELMAAPAIPANEEQRLEELSKLHLVDSEPEPVFDRITKKMARAFDVPIAMVSFVDKDRQFFKSQVGLSGELAKERGTSRAQSICGHVVFSNDALVVEDLAKDKRFANNPFVKEQSLRFYAGIPLHGPNGLPIGSVCILDTKPRELSEREKRHLTVVAEEINDEIAARAPNEIPAQTPIVENL
ncbi:MAG: Phytochrome sensor protein [Chthoniobacteraceae bacterium]|nr:Phytochrome sensor protein [Chthoniobacteraceae bacterium]